MSTVDLLSVICYRFDNGLGGGNIYAVIFRASPARAGGRFSHRDRHRVSLIENCPVGRQLRACPGRQDQAARLLPSGHLDSLRKPQATFVTVKLQVRLRYADIGQLYPRCPSE